MDPWFKLYAADYLLDGDVAAMPLTAQGILVRLWCLAWRDGSFPDDLPLVARRIGVDLKTFRRHFRSISALFRLQDGAWTSARMRRERSKTAAGCRVENAQDVKIEDLQKKNDPQKEAPRGRTGARVFSESESDTESEKTTTIPPTPRKRGKPKEPPKEPGEYPEAVAQVVNAVVGATPEEDPQGRKIRVDAATLADRVHALLREHQALTAPILVQSWLDYLASKPGWIKAPQYFFGRKDDQRDGAHWHPYAALIWHQKAKAARQADARAPDQAPATEARALAEVGP